MHKFIKEKGKRERFYKLDRYKIRDNNNKNGAYNLKWNQMIKTVINWDHKFLILFKVN